MIHTSESFWQQVSSPDGEVFTIAEIGKNFIQTEEDRPVEEYLKNAKELVKAAKESGASSVKFQTHEVEDEQLSIDVISPHFKGSNRHSWVTRNTKSTPLETFWKPLRAYCDELDITFFSTPMSRKAAKKLNALDVQLWKVGSGDVRDHVMLDYLIDTRKPIVLSNGMVSLQELDEVIDYVTTRHKQLAVMYCVSQYPAPPEYFNLGTIDHLKEKHPDIPIGFSDHSIGYDIVLAAVKLGARIIEKHFSLSRDLWGSDHKVSMTPSEFKAMTDAIRSGAYKDVDETPYYGTKEKELDGATNKFRPYFYKSLMAGTDIPKGTVLTKDMIYAMRPQMHAGGLPSEQFDRVVEKKTTRDLKKYDPITDDTAV